MADYIETQRKNGSKGGKKTLKKLGRAHYSKIGKEGGSKPKKKRRK